MIEVQIISKTYPLVYKYKVPRLKSELYKVEFQVIQSITKNCQTFSLSPIYKLFYISSKNFELLLDRIYKDFERPQFIADVQNEYKKAVLEKLKKYCNVIQKDYISTNGNKMCLLICQIKKYL